MDVRELITACVEVEQHRAESLGLTLTTNLPARLSAVTGDFEALRRVIRGLIDNAIKYTPQGGRITVSAREAVHRMTISVSDTGKGIPESDIPYIFDKFYRVGDDSTVGSPGTSAPGVGLGLYLAQHIVSQLRGQINVESKQGVGSTFTVVLPLSIEDVVAKRSEENRDVKALVGS